MVEMEQDYPINNKRPSSNPEIQNEQKKVKHFNAKEFRKQLNSSSKLQALQDFQNSIKSEPSKRDCIVDYLQNGGTCIELLQTLEFDSTLPPSLVFEIVAYVLLKVNASCPQYQNSSIEACRYVLNNYVTVVNKMLNLSSTTPERKACLKLLTAMVALSPALAKDILVHVNFHSTNVELLTKHTGEKDSVRDHFVRFLTAFLVDGHYPALSMLLEKKGFITSIIGGLQYDDADTLCMVISAMKNFILENPSVSKTAKMKTFNTTVVRDIVNLYNWKGPQGFKSEKKKNKSTSLTTVDEVEKAKVSECVHDFLLVLCSSHKHGVIFKDHLLGLGKKYQNPLMYTVLESLERPWDHSYASELVIKICGTCPDLAKTMWNILKPSLEPRYSDKWMNSVKFAKNLIKEFQPSCIEFCVNELSPYQIFQVTQCLVAPMPIIKTLMPDQSTFDNIMVKNMVLSVILEMLKALSLYLNSAKVWLSKENFEKYHVCIRNYVAKNFPETTVILKDWNKSEEIAATSANDLIETVFSIFEFYKKLSPSLLDKLFSVELDELLAGIESIFKDDTSLLAKVQIKVITVFIDIDASKFTTKTELFSRVVPVLLEYYYGTKDSDCLLALTKLFKYTNIFQGCEYEIHLWINGILDLKKYDNDVARNIVEIMKITDNSVQQFLEQLSSYTKKDAASIRADILEMLLNCEITESPTITIKHKYLSPMILGFSQFLTQNEITKPLKTYCTSVLLNLFHLQTDVLPLINCLSDTKLPLSYLESYFHSWVGCTEIQSIPKVKGRIATSLKRFSEAFLSEDITTFLETDQLDYYVDYPFNLLTIAVFYVSNLLKNDVLSEEITINYRKLVIYLIKQKHFNNAYIPLILGHPVLVPNFSCLNLQKQTPQSFASNVTIEIIKYFIEAGYDIESYLKLYRKKLFNAILKILHKPQKYEEYRITLRNLLLVFELEYEQCQVVLKTISELSKNFESTSTVVLEILNFALKTFSLVCKSNVLKPLEGKVVKHLSKYIAELNKHELETNDVSVTLCEYLEIFPHNFGDIHISLFKSIIQRSEISKGNIRLATLLLERNDKYVDVVREYLDIVCEKKSLILALVQVLEAKHVDDDFLNNIFDKVEPVLMKALQKPQKAGQHFHQNYVGAASLIEKFFDLEKCNGFVQKVQKYEVTEVFHIHLLYPIYNKIIDQNISAKYTNNIILNFTHFQIAVFKRNLKTEEDIHKLDQIATVFCKVLEKLRPYCSGKDLQSTCNNESLKLYCKYCLKFGISGQHVLLRALRNLLSNLADNFNSDTVKLLMEMFVSHSEFLDNVLGKNSDLKEEIMRLFLTFCQHWPDIMERSHLPVLFASYTAMVNRCDRVILLLLKMYESRADVTKFYDFKPFLWGKAAASHYSVRSNIENALWRQPKMSDVLDILQEHVVISTIIKYPFKDNLDINMEDNMDQKDEDCYDLKFLLLVFSQLLAPEQQVQTYKFSRSGALSLTVVALSSQSTEVRHAACHILSRFRFHLEGRQTGKDNPLWIRYIDAVCKGTSALPDFKLNHFAAIYLAKMAMVLTQPTHVMYLPLSQHLTAKSSLDFSTVPELYTFLHSPDVNFKEHRRFTLELLRDGLRTEKDFSDFVRSMAFKLISELYVSCLSDSDTKLLILDVFASLCKIPLAVRVLCDHHSFISQLTCDLESILSSFTKDNAEIVFISKILQILLYVVKVYHEKSSAFLIFMMLEQLLSSELFGLLPKIDEKVFYEVMYLTYDKCPEFYSKSVIDKLLKNSDDSFCKYVTEYGCKFVDIKTLNQDDPKYYLKLLVIKTLS